MKKHEWVAGVGEMKQEALEYLIGNESISGIIFGDYFCTKRMYAGGMAEMLKFMHWAYEANKRIYFRTRAFVTSENYSEMLEMISTVCSIDPMAVIMCQDIGLASDIKRLFPGHEIIWSRMARNREDLVTAETVKFLKDMGISSAIEERTERIRSYQSLGMQVFGVYGDYSWVSFGRTCYNTDQTLTPPEECGHICRRGWYLIKSGNGFKLSMDGYVLGEKYNYIKDIASVLQICTTCFVEAPHIEEWKKRFSEAQKALGLSSVNT